VHGEVALTPLAVWIGLLVRFGVPMACAAIAIDVLRRPPASIGRRARVFWVVVPLAVLVSLLAGFLLPSVVALRYFAVLAVPFTLVIGVAYLLSVVFAREAAAGSGTL